MTLVLRNVRPWGGDRIDIALAQGRIAAIGHNLPRAPDEIDGRGDVVLPGLHDHHLHILALAARRQSIDLTGLCDIAAVRSVLAKSAPVDGWLRAVGYDERVGGLPDTALLDGWAGDWPLRLQDRTGALWVLNSRGMAHLGNRQLPAGAELDAAGRATGRFWREDQWLAGALARSPPDLATLGHDLASFGLTALTDATAHNGPAEARLLAGALPQHLTLMGSEALPEGRGYMRGPLKLLIDERDAPDPDGLAARIVAARAQRRNVAAHCVTEAELVLYLAALTASGGAHAGDRIEHGGLISQEALTVIAEAGLIVVTNPGFIHDRGDRYCATIAADDRANLYRAQSLLDAGIPLLAGSDAPYADVDPWLAMRAARDRRTAGGVVLAAQECVGALAALRLFAPRPITVGSPGDLVLCAGPMTELLADLGGDRVRATFIAGKMIFERGR
ncbi:MAG: amidohydrolase family protein [Rudaea sp.]|nr:amidohydrolase family protein [Rudaea sp.]